MDFWGNSKYKNNHLFVNGEEIITREYTNIGEIGNENG